MLIGAPRTGLVAARTLGLAALATAVGMTVMSGCGSPDGEASDTAAPQTIVTSTTKIAGAGVLGNQRRPDESCPAEPAAVDPGPPERMVRHAAGETLVRADPQRIVVLSGDQLDALCALGLQSRIVAAALPDGSDSQPSYLGQVIHDVPGVGTRSEPDLDGIRAAAPDLILGSHALTPEAFGPLSDIAPTVFSGPPGAAWQDNLRTVGAATGRQDAANGLVEGFHRAADKTGADNDATHFQASVVQFTDTTMRVYGVDTFPGSVLADVGVDRPVTQRFTDKPYIEVGVSDTDLADDPDLSIADGDIVYVSFDSPAARDRAPAVLESDAWKKLGATRDNRVFAVNNEVWQTGENIVAARGMLADLQWLNAPIN
ncbi:Fe3+-citrate ABC transporter substrate-binding protein [Mycolicibacterium novocastrense]|uniref:iron-siderophore ABC transporter substrate-binding protein n=1 Tax=Mycolicibacterium novocastrense TaxID=59813 RepID=UPI00074A4A71|nr:iron-siderophore ABC transporter substrate-binding protein [Mycolicibacterium novocastrense]KUH64165.1 Fe3+-citrate ABC transporter substrate-binding protein [Mycolicibacterium novocastrense]KUH68222.1 Fe3+-citrate ABC transporter substrate-binding protein [Mycolicibacterium novocastrense]KUH68627.1 Fe3+-citrate ABC transporter substrate-binding protein [Mycolicibacterium novocastrense]